MVRPSICRMCRQGAHHETVRLKAYPTREFGEIIWAYLGPQEDGIPEVPHMEFGFVEPAGRYVTKQLMECNWAQVMEGDPDTSHFLSAYAGAERTVERNPDAPADERRLKWIRNDPMPKFQILEHDVGFVVGARRRQTTPRRPIGA